MQSESTSQGQTLIRASVFVVAMCFVVPSLSVAMIAAGLSPVLSICAAVVLFVGVALPASRGLPRVLVEGRAQRALFALWLVLGFVGAYRVAHLSVFMLDVQKTDYAFVPTIRELSNEQFAKPFHPRHNCFTSYVVGAHLASQGAENIYGPDQYRDPIEETAVHRTIGDAVTIDRFQYPPPFMLLPWLLSEGGDFFAVRTWWFSLEVLTFCTAAVLLGSWLGGGRFGMHWFAVPIVLMAPNTLATLQIGNAHFLVICLAVLGMLQLERSRNLPGAMLLGFVIVSKIFPALLLVYLLVRGRWRAVIWTCGAMVLYCLLTLLVFGAQPFESFVSYQLPRIANGDAFAFAREHIRAVVLNMSLMGVAYKMSRLELLGGVNPQSLAGIISWFYTAVVAVVVVMAGLRHRWISMSMEEDGASELRRVGLARVWLALLILAQLRSPFLPWVYGSVVVLWLLALLIPTDMRRFRYIAWLAPAWVVFAVMIPLAIGPASAALDMYFTLGALAVLLVFCLTIVLGRSRPGWTVSPVSVDDVGGPLVRRH